ncbi:MAG TPA: class I SAM-dependent methyltransferase, partial [Polyangia bacterium]|nr:class I SAM-dependent methyltransferase [Polyangia bacterium]
QRAAEPLLRALPRDRAVRLFEYGCATGRLAAAVAERLAPGSRIVGVDPSPAMIDTAQAGAQGARAFQTGELQSLSVEAGSFDLAISNLAIGELSNPAAGLTQLARVVKPGGRALVTLALRGCWTQFLDLYREVLREQHKQEALKALARYENSLPDAGTAVRWLEAAGLERVTVETHRWELLFKSAREFFFAPIIEYFPLPVWKQIAGGRGDEMQDVFFFVKEAIETYFSGTVFPVTMVVGLLQGEKRAS